MQAATNFPEMRAVDELASLIIKGVFGGLIDSEESRRTRRLCADLIRDYQALSRLRSMGSGAGELSAAEQSVVACHAEAVALIAYFRGKLSAVE